MLKYYHPSDANYFKFRDMEEIQNILQRNPRYLYDLHKYAQGNVYTIWSGSEPVAIGGWSEADYDNASLFMSASRDLKSRFNKEIMIDFKKVVNECCSRHKRVECVVAEDEANKRFIEFLGFNQDCKLKNYNFDGSDMYLYSRVNDENKNRRLF